VYKRQCVSRTSSMRDETRTSGSIFHDAELIKSNMLQR